MPFLFPTGASARDALDVLGAFPITFEAITPALISGNLLTLDQQRSQSGVSNVLCTGVSSPTGGADGGGTYTATATAADATTQWWSNNNPANRVAVVAGTAYTGSIRYRLVAGTGSWRLSIAWFNSGGTFISSSAGSSVAGIVGSHVTLTATGTAPVGAVTAGMAVIKDPPTSAIGDSLELSVACFRTSVTIPFSSGAALRLRGELFAAWPAVPTGTGCVRVQDGRLVITASGAAGGASFFTGAMPSPPGADVPCRWTATVFSATYAGAFNFIVGFNDVYTTPATLATNNFATLAVYLAKRNFVPLTWGINTSSSIPTNGAEITIGQILFEVLA